MNWLNRPLLAFSHLMTLLCLILS